MWPVDNLAAKLWTVPIVFLLSVQLIHMPAIRLVPQPLYVQSNLILVECSDVQPGLRLRILEDAKSIRICPIGVLPAADHRPSKGPAY